MVKVSAKAAVSQSRVGLSLIGVRDGIFLQNWGYYQIRYFVHITKLRYVYQSLAYTYYGKIPCVSIFHITLKFSMKHISRKTSLRSRIIMLITYLLLPYQETLQPTLNFILSSSTSSMKPDPERPGTSEKALKPIKVCYVTSQQQQATDKQHPGRRLIHFTEKLPGYRRRRPRSNVELPTQARHRACIVCSVSGCK